MSNQQTLQQRRAAQAFKDVQEMVVLLEKDKKDSTANEYGTIIRGFPALIQTDGLATALAFLQAKGKSAHRATYQHISAWVMTQLTGKTGDLLNWLMDASTFQYRQATAEALAYTTWLKRFVEANDLKSSNN